MVVFLVLLFVAWPPRAQAATTLVVGSSPTIVARDERLTPEEHPHERFYSVQSKRWIDGCRGLNLGWYCVGGDVMVRNPEVTRR